MPQLTRRQRTKIPSLSTEPTATGKHDIAPSSYHMLEGALYFPLYKRPLEGSKGMHGRSPKKPTVGRHHDPQ